MPNRWDFSDSLRQTQSALVLEDLPILYFDRILVW
jgi:hypothetical protein